MRKKKWAEPYIEAHEELVIPDPAVYKGKWRELLGVSELHVEIGMGKGGRRKKEPLSPVNAFTETPDFENSCDSSKCRYLYYFDKRLKDSALQTTSPSVGWGLEAVKACKRAISKAETAKIRIPVLLIQAGNDTMVDNAGQVLFASRVPSCTFTQVPGMKHELYMTDSDVLIPYWEKIFAFLG